MGGPPVDDVGLPPASKQVTGVEVPVAHRMPLWKGVQ